MKIFMPTSNNYVRYAEISAALLNKYWPDHPPVEVCHHERCPAIGSDRYRLIDQGPQQATNGYIGQMLNYLKNHNGDDLVFFLSDDYGLCGAVNQEAVAAGVHLLRGNPLLISFALTWQPTRKEPYPGRSDVVLFPKWDWSINFQAGIFRRTTLWGILQAIAPTCNPLDFEQAASHWCHANLYDQGYRTAGWNCLEPPNPSGYVDNTDKSGWAVPYHNLSHRRRFEERHREFLRKEGIIL